MKIFDAHCDVLMKMYLDSSIDFYDESLQINYPALVTNHSKVQCFAIYIPESVPMTAKFNAALSMSDIFLKKIVTVPNMKHVKTKQDIIALKEGEIGAILTLEGCDCIYNEMNKLEVLLNKGVTSVGLTWNYANFTADGALEKRGAGLTEFGEQVVKELNSHAVWCDVSHLSEKAFWDVFELAEYPIASHSNAYGLCANPRNLKDDQIKELIRKEGVIGVTFVPQFLTERGQAEIHHVLSHLDYICSLGGQRNVGFGSDFDGITHTVPGLSSYSQYDNLVNELYKRYSASQVEGFLYGNFMDHLPDNRTK
ncbi:dipeptidase [Peribacillus sp. SCS-155]|uniref:dipeptidase n=1 Tax=Peribacillus sedimenti TaxID=3115297 RepID=UPI0039069CCE